MKTITTVELQRRVESGEQLNIIDVREADEVASGMIQGAKHIPLGDIEEKSSELSKDVPYYLVCRSGGRSGIACEFLNGVALDATNVEGGMLSWNGETIA